MNRHKMIPQPIANIAGPGNSGAIPGKYNPGIADDITINAKRGEYIISPEDVALLGGPKMLNEIIRQVRLKHGLPTRTGPKTNNQPDRFGRKDKPGLKGIAGFADSGDTDWKPPYETDLGELAAAHPIANVVGLGIPAVAQKIAGEVGNVASAMNTPTDPMAIVKGRTQDVADQLGSTTRNLSQPAALATRAITGQPFTGDSLPLSSQANGITASPGMPPIAGGPGAAPTSSPRAADITTPPLSSSDPGSGFARIGGKRIDYSNIGIAGKDPLSNSKSGGGIVYASGGDPSGRDVDWSPGSANNIAAMSDANRKNGLMTDSSSPGGVRLMTRGEAASLGLVTPQQQFERNNADIKDYMRTIAGNVGNQYDGAEKIASARLNMATLQNANQQLLRNIAGNQDLEGQKYAADATLAGRKIAANAGIAQQQIAGLSNIQASQIAAYARTAAEREKARQDAQKQRNDTVKSHLSRYDFTGISPATANEYAAILADTDGKGFVTLRDPSGTYGDILVHQGIEQPLRGAYNKIKTPVQFLEYLNQARRLGGSKIPVYKTGIKNSARLPLIKSRQDPALEGIGNG